jgi:hypothetical protein
LRLSFCSSWKPKRKERRTGPTQFLDDTTLSMRRCKSELSASTRASETEKEDRKVVTMR